MTSLSPLGAVQGCGAVGCGICNAQCRQRSQGSAKKQVETWSVEVATAAYGAITNMGTRRSEEMEAGSTRGSLRGLQNPFCHVQERMS